MSGFSPAWLALREAADHHSRNREVCCAVSDAFAGREPLAIVDLGAGTGANLRATVPALPAIQRWRLVDHDPALLHAARPALRDWADDARMAAGRMVLRRADIHVKVDFVAADLQDRLEAVLAGPCDLVTAAALFDLVSRSWIDRLVAALARRRLPLYATLIYDGTERWHPPHGADEAMRTAFLAHQRGDKGFGPAAGPDAGACLADGLGRAGFTVTMGASPWTLGLRDRALIVALAEGAAQAAAETGQIREDIRAEWLSRRRAAAACRIGHVDLFAMPA